MNTATLLPNPDRFHLEYIACSDNTLTITVTSVQKTAPCPICGQSSQRIHSRYQRTLADLPWNQIAVRIHLRARKFFCDQPDCKRLVFTEPLPQLAARYARKTLRLNTALYLIGYALGGEAGAKVAVGLGLCVSPDTLLNRVRQEATAPLPQPAVQAVGVDDFAFRKGLRYGTILVDLDRHRLLDLLPDRTAESLTEWLKAHPQIQLVSRDRASAYSEGAKEGAPQAKQVADRWHLFKNLGDMLERLLCRHYKPMREVTRQMAAASTVEAEAQRQIPVKLEDKPAPSASAKPLTRAEQHSALRREKRLCRYEQVMELRRQKLSVRAIARKTGLCRNTLRKWLNAGCFREQAKPGPRRSQLAPFTDYLKTRWDDGIHNATLLFAEIQEQGYTGSIAVVQRYMKPWRKLVRGQPHPHREEPPSSRTVMWWHFGYVSKDAALRQKQTAFVEQLAQLCPEVKTAQEMVLRFAEMIKQRRSEQLNDWLNEAAQSQIAELRNFAKSLRQDYAAVQAALSSEWSNGQTEGQVNRLKLVKRQMYGRAKFDLLRARVLPMQQAA